MDYPRIIRGLKVLISLNFVLLLFIPIGYSYGPTSWDDMGGVDFDWSPSYFYSEEFFLWLMVPLGILWLIYTLNNYKTLKLIVGVLLFGNSACCSFIAFLSGGMLAQDYSASWGLLSLFLFCPLLMLLFITEQRSSKSSLKPTLHTDTILDENNF